MNSAMTELAKNLILTGVNVDIYDNYSNGNENIETLVSELDIASNFFLNNDDLGKSRASVLLQKLKNVNTLIKLEKIVNFSNINFQNYNCVIYGFESFSLSNNWEKLCSNNRVPFYILSCCGDYGYFYLNYNYKNNTKMEDINESNEDRKGNNSNEM